MLVPVTLAELLQVAPWAEVDVVDGSYGDLVKSLRDGTIDVVIGALREPPEGDLQDRVPPRGVGAVYLGSVGCVIRRPLMAG